ncbi:MAG: S8 family serine peptidase [Candidatus Zixiibacteriota bacterium]
MWKYVIIGIVVFAWIAAFAAEPPLKIDAKEQKIEKRLEQKLQESKPENRIKVWVFFTDKEVFDQTSLKKSAAEARDRFTDRAITRRSMRSPEGDGYDFYDVPVSENYVNALKSAGLEVKRISRWLNGVSGYGDRKVIEAISQLPFVSEIREVARGVRIPEPEISPEEGNFVPKMKEAPADIPDSVVGWYGSSFVQLNLVNVPVMHQLGYTGAGVLIAIFDTGFKLTHPNFNRLNVIDQYDFINDDDNVTDSLPGISQLSHGTAVLSVVGGRTDDVLIGSAYGADYLLGKTEITNVEDTIEEDNWVAAAEWADSLGADVISTSVAYFDWYTYEDLDGQTAKITIAAEVASSRGITVVSSAGNERNKDFFWITPPADGPSVIAVGAVSSAGLITSFSSSGPTYDGRIKPDVVAMGNEIYRALYSNDDYSGGASGTSFSAPITAGAVALLLEVHPDWSPSDVRQALIEAADRYEEPDTLYGYGLYDTYKAAKLMGFDPIPPIFVAVGDSLNLTISVSGYEDISGVTTISAENSPPTAEFTDNGDRTATIRYAGIREDVGSRRVTFNAVSGDAEVSVSVSFTVTLGQNVTAGPNPFTDSLVIFVGAGGGEVEEISIFTANGEKVWDNFSDNYNKETGTIVWKGVNNSGAEVTAGVYLVYVRTENITEKFKVFRK